MKKILTILVLAATAMTGCIQDEVLDSGKHSEAGAVEFGTYLGRSVTTRATVITSETLKSEGFGVNAWYTGLTPFDAAAIADYDVFMNNTRIVHDGTMWSYSPLKYWPNNPGDMVSFVAYAPHMTDADGNTNQNITIAGTDLTYVVANEVKEQVDLLWSDSSESGYNTIDLEKQAVDDKVTLLFKHALSKISFKVGALVDMVEDDTADGLLDSDVLAPETIIKVKKVVLMGGNDTYEDTEGWLADGNGPFYTDGTLSLMDGSWSGQNSGQRFEFTAAEHFIVDDSGEFVLDDSNSDQLNELLNDESYLMIIPQDLTADGFKIYIEYDVITEDDALSDGNVIVENKITSAEAITSINFEQGKQYNINMILGMTTVKFDVEVIEWIPADDEDSDNPANENLQGGTDSGDDDNLDEEIVDIEGLDYSVTNQWFYIGSVDDLNNMTALINDGKTYVDPADNTSKTFTSATYMQTEDLDFSSVEKFYISHVAGNGQTNFTPIGKYGHVGAAFSGTYVGQGHSITGLSYVHDTDAGSQSMYVALFQATENAIISNLIVSGEIVNALVTAGIVACDNGNSLIDACVSNVKITGTYRNIGGIVGTSNGTQITGCTNNGEIIGENCDWVGGIVGYSQGATTVEACANTGSITGDYNVGGLLGNDVGTAAIYASYNTGTINAAGVTTGATSNPAGGLVGTLKGVITGCYNVGAVLINGTEYNQDTFSHVGAIAGLEWNDNLESTDAIKACYWGGSCVSDNGFGISGWAVTDDVMDAMNDALIASDCDYVFVPSADDTLFVPTLNQ